MSETLSHKTIKGTIWSACDRFGVMGLQFVVNIVLSRLLTPSDFGAIGMLTIFIALSMTLIDGGFGSALIQKKNPTETDYSTIFFWNLGIGLALYLILYFSSPLIASFYKIPILSGVLRAVGLTLIFSSVSNIQTNRLRKNLRFKDLAVTNIGSYVCASIVAIVMAYKGYGVWSLVAMTLMQGLMRIIWLYFITHWIPAFIFSVKAFKELFSFGGYLFISFILESICKNIQGLVIGRKFSAAEMGFYTQANKLDNVTSYAIPQTIATVIYPVMSQYQDKKEKLICIMATNLRIISFFIWPLLSLLILIAAPLINFLYGHQWEMSIPYYQILCCGGFFMCINNIPYYAVAASGKSKALLMISFYKWSCLGIFILIGMNFGMDGIVWSLSISTANIFFANLWLSKKYIGFKFSDCLKSLWPAGATTALSVLSVCLLHHIIYENWIITIIIFILSYIAISFLINRAGLEYSFTLLKKLRKND